MKKIQFLTDSQGNKTSVLVDIHEHQAFWQDVINEVGELLDFQFLLDEQGEKVAVLLELSKHGELWEDLYDILVSDYRENEANISWEGVKQNLKTKRELNV